MSKKKISRKSIDNMDEKELAKLIKEKAKARVEEAEDGGSYMLYYSRFSARENTIVLDALNPKDALYEAAIYLGLDDDGE